MKDDFIAEIKATAGPKLLRNVNRYFTNTLEALAVELLQNCRRAGARHVDISITATHVTVEDDGRGLAAEDAGILLSFGGSMNDDLVEHDEAAAGMGVFCLARRGATIASRDWSMSVTPAAFQGREGVALRRTYDHRDGLAVTFPLTEDVARSFVFHAFDVAAQPMPYRTTIDGVAVKRFKPLDRLHDRHGHPLFDDMIETSLGDCIITVARFENERVRFLRKPHSESTRILPPDDIYCVADIFGHVLRLPPSEDGHLDGASFVSFEGPIAVPETGHRERMVQPGYLAVVETTGSDTLVTQLPDRRHLVANAELDAVRAEILRCALTLAARSPGHGLRDVSEEMLDFIERHGIKLPPAQAQVVEPRYPDDLRQTDPRAGRIVATIGGDGRSDKPREWFDGKIVAVKPHPLIEAALRCAEAGRDGQPPTIYATNADRYLSMKQIEGFCVQIGTKRYRASSDLMGFGFDEKADAETERALHSIATENDFPDVALIKQPMGLVLELRSKEKLHLPLTHLILSASFTDPHILVGPGASLEHVWYDVEATFPFEGEDEGARSRLRRRLAAQIGQVSEPTADDIADLVAPLVTAGAAGISVDIDRSGTRTAFTVTVTNADMVPARASRRLRRTRKQDE